MSSGSYVVWLVSSEVWEEAKEAPQCDEGKDATNEVSEDSGTDSGNHIDNRNVHSEAAAFAVHDAALALVPVSSAEVAPPGEDPLACIELVFSTKMDLHPRQHHFRFDTSPSYLHESVRGRPAPAVRRAELLATLAKTMKRTQMHLHSAINK